MATLATGRLAPWSPRGDLKQVSAAFPLPGEDHRVGPFIVTYAFDLLSSDRSEVVLNEVLRPLTGDGPLSVVSLTNGLTWGGRSFHQP